MKIKLIFFFLFYVFVSQAQNLVFKCILLDQETHEPVAGVQMKLVCKNYTKKSIICDTLATVSDDKGLFQFSAKPSYRFELLTTDKKYRLQGNYISITDTSHLITYYLNAPGFTDYYPDFFFNENASIPQDTSMFYYWDLNTRQDVSSKIMLTGFYAPGENKKIAFQRAKAVYDGFVKRGANPNAFVINGEAFNETTLYHGQYVFISGEDNFFKKGAIINTKYIQTLKGSRKEAAKQLLRAVRLTN